MATKPYISRLEEKVAVLKEVLDASKRYRDAKHRAANTGYPADAQRALRPAELAWENAMFEAEVYLNKEE